MFYLGRVKIDKKYLDARMDQRTTLDHFLCSFDGAGVCATTLLAFLASSNNEFISCCYSGMGYEGKAANVQLPSVTLNDVINYDQDRDLLPLIYAHCDYTLEIGEQPKVDYNFLSLQKHLAERLVVGKSKIDVVISQFVYNDDIHTANKHSRIKEKIPQVCIFIFFICFFLKLQWGRQFITVCYLQ